MDNLLTQGLVGLVFVLSVALWSKSSSSTSTSKEFSASQKNKKKKKKGNAVSPSSEVADAAGTSNATIPPDEVISTPPNALAEKPAAILAKLNDDSKANTKLQQNGTSNGSKKAASTASKKKMTLEHFVAKTNEERVEEIERAARGDAGDKDLGADMIDKDLQPETSYKKTARIEPAVTRAVHTARSADDGWENVGGKAKIGQPIVASTKSSNKEVSSNAWASSNPFALLPGSGAEPVRTSNSATTKTTSTSSQASSSAAAQAQTKKQRQNAAKVQAKKAEKESIEKERLARLAQHKKQVEAERMKEQFRKQSSGVSAPFSVHPNGNSKSASTLPKASINEKGSLVWD